MFSTLQSCGREGSDFAHSRTTLQANFNLQFQFIMYTKNRSRSPFIADSNSLPIHQSSFWCNGC